MGFSQVSQSVHGLHLKVSMPDYKQMYLTLFRATEQVINTLIEAQRACEELYISEPETGLRVSPMPDCTEEEKE